MVRTQVYLTEEEHKSLAAIVGKTGKKKSELIRQGVDLVIKQASRERRDEILARLAGIWKDRDDLPDFQAMRAEADRRW